MEESISLEETNKIRISLGLKPLSATKDDSADSQEKQAEDNFAKKKEQEAKDRESKRIQDRIAKVKNKRELNASLKGATLGDPDADGDDALSWVKKSKKREKLLAKKRMEELENMDKLFQEEYTEKDLQGLKVSHNFEELGEGEDRILTLKDSRILDNEEDELQNVEMAEEERNKKNNELKIKKKDYKGYDDEEFGDGQSGVRRSILAKYDEDLEGTSEIGFRLGSSVPKKAEKLKEEQQAAAATVNKSLLSIDYSKNLEVTDYLQEGDVGFKKPKTKKKRPSRRVAEDSGIEPVSSSNGTNGNGTGNGAGAGDGEDKMDIDVKPTRTRTRDLDMNFIDDDELQASLARARRAKMMKKPKVLTQEEVARKLVEERIKNEASEAIKLEEGDDEAAGGLVFDDTSEFIRSVQYNPEVKQEPKSRDEVRVKSESTQRDVHMKDVAGGSNGDGDGDADNNENDSDEDMEAGEIAMKEEEDEEAILHALQHAIDTGELNLKQEEGEGQGEGQGQGDGKGEGENGVDSINGTSSQLSYGSGIGATLNILRQQGILSTPSSTQQEREKTQRQRDIWLAEYRTRLALRELERVRAKGEKRDQAQREYENRVREQQEAREGMEMFREYKPDVNIVYHDEFGRELSAKEAWKALSHRFHGKGSGKMKTEKRLKKIAEERKKEAMASGDTPLSMNRAFQQRQEKTGQAHFVLSVGNRGAVPQVAEYLEPPTLSKGKTEKSKKKKDTGKEDKSQGPNSFNNFNNFNNFLNNNGIHNNHNHNSNFNTNNAGSANNNNNVDITGFTSRPLSSSLSPGPGPGRGFSPIPGPGSGVGSGQGQGHSNGASPSPAPGLSPGPGFSTGFGTGFGSGSSSMMKKSFSQVSEPASGAGTPIGGSASGNGNGFGNGFGSGGGNGNGNGGERGGERVKVAFGFGTKRKAAGEGMGTPPQKRR